MLQTDSVSEDVSEASGLHVLLDSPCARMLHQLWMQLNAFVRPLLPLIHLFVFIGTLLVVVSTFFANQHLPCWSDELFMIEPAYYRTHTGVWQSHVAWDSFFTMPYAPNYPLFINFLRLPISLFGVHFRILRGIMIALGVAPIGFLLWLFRKKGIYKNRFEVIFAAFFSACCTAFYCAVYVRPEAMLLTVVAFFIFFWMTDHDISLFLISLLVPLCGLQWNVLLLPVVLHWLLFGGRLRKPVLVVIAFLCSSVATIVAYHAFGMWTSYLQEAARVGGLDVIPRALAKMHDAFSKRDFLFLSNALYPYDALPGDIIFVSGAFSVFCGQAYRGSRKIWFFSFATYYGVMLTVAFLGSINPQYPKLLLFIPAFVAPVLFRQVWCKYPIFLFAFVLVFSYIALVHWQKISGNANHLSDVATDVSSSAAWVDELALERIVSSVLTPDDVVCCESPSYFAVRSKTKEMLPLVFAFDLSPQQRREITMLVLQDEPYRIFDRDRALFRKSTFAATLQSVFWNPCSSPAVDLWDFEISLNDLLSTIADRWHCNFEEVPVPSSRNPNTISFRLFRPVFLD